MDEQHNKLVAYVLDFPEEAARTIADLRQKRADHERLIGELKQLLESDYPMHALDLVRAEFEEINGPKN